MSNADVRCHAGLAHACAPGCIGTKAVAWTLYGTVRPRSWPSWLACAIDTVTVSGELVRPQCICVGANTFIITEDLERANPRVVKQIVDNARSIGLKVVRGAALKTVAPGGGAP